MTAVPHPLPAPPRRDRYVYGLALGTALFLSLLMHGSLFFSLLRGGGPPAGSGEGGVRGAGDMTVDISVAGPVAPVITPPEHAAPMPTPTPPSPPVPEPTPAVVPPHTTHPHEADRVETAEPDSTPTDDQAVTPPSPPEQAASTPAGREATIDIPATGTGADTTSGGRAPGLPDDALRSLILGMAGDAPESVESQRALLPAATTCQDPIAGTWRAFKYSPMVSDWVRFTLVIHHAPNGDLTGTITSRIWTGGPFDRTPPACTDEGQDYTTRMPAHGHADANNHITFNSSTFETIAVHCPQLFHDYAPDNFSGTIDPTRQEFQSVNNDGAYDINAPYVFRRTGCVDE